MNKSIKKNVSGFTLIEMMVTVTILAVLLGTGVPSFRTALMDNRVETQAEVFFTALNLARAQAIKRNQQVSLCKSSDGETCSGSAEWEDGWIVFVDDNGDGTLNAGEFVVQTGQPLTPGLTLRSGGAYSDWLAYTPSGSTRGSGGASDTFRVCSSAADEAKARSIAISLTGRPRLKKGAVSCP